VLGPVAVTLVEARLDRATDRRFRLFSRSSRIAL
jgi:hypothetical protein